MNVYVGNRLPSTYQEVEYILNSSGEYIDTGFVPKSTTRVKCKVMVTGYTSGQDNGGIYGIWLNWRGNTRFNLWHWSSSGYGFGYGNNNGSSYCVNVPLNTITEADNYISNGTVYNIINGTTTTYSGATFSGTTGNIYLFRRNIGGGQRDSGTAYTRFYYMKIYDNGTLVRDFIPCYRKSDSEIGLYDLVNSVFYTNAGTGTFSKGNDVTMAVLKNAYIGEAPYEGDALCFTADAANSKLHFSKQGNPTSVTIEMNINGLAREPYTFGTIITLPNIGDKIYFRNTSTTTTGLNTSYSDGYFIYCFSGSISCSGDVTYLLNKNGTTTLSNYCFCNLFADSPNMTSCPKLLATTVPNWAYAYMFKGCTGLTTLPKLPATTLNDYCYTSMFSGCSKIKLSTTKTGAYQTSYRIPITGTGTAGNYPLINMFTSTGGTFTGAPSINTTYYTSNTVV